MRGGRIKIRGVDAVYHCMSRTVNGERSLGVRHREVLQRMLLKVAEFSGVRVITYCLMENHFHVLVRVPGVDRPSDKELVRRFRLLYPKPGFYQPMSADRLELVLSKGGAEAESLRRVLLARMGDVSEFMKTLKQRFSIWFNQFEKRFGPVWSDRFKSVLVEGGHSSLKTVAAYIDLNPVRAGIVRDPGEYAFSGFGKASTGRQFELVGIRSLGGGRALQISEYRNILRGKGELSGGGRDSGVGDFDRDSNELLKRNRYFTNGKILGSEGFVRDLLEGMLVFHEATRRRRCPMSVGVAGGVFAGTSVRRRKTCQREVEKV